MRCKSTRLLAFLLALLALRQGIVWLDSGIPMRSEQAAIIEARDIEPAALFYTESPQARAAGRKLAAR